MAFSERIILYFCKCSALLSWAAYLVRHQYDLQLSGFPETTNAIFWWNFGEWNQLSDYDSQQYSALHNKQFSINVLLRKPLSILDI
jgi:hypothetical protein